MSVSFAWSQKQRAVSGKSHLISVGSDVGTGLCRQLRREGHKTTLFFGSSPVIERNVIDKLNSARLSHLEVPSRSGGIGRRGGFKIRCSQGHAGSSPASGTIL